MSESARRLFKKFISTGLMSYPMYNHQYEMLRHGLEGKDAVITSGTGSGKTEAFLLPLFADIIREAAAEWPSRKDKPYLLNEWWKGRIEERSLLDLDTTTGTAQLSANARQRSEITRPAAIRAIVLYPMNALVEDQVTRLREALDSDEVQKFMDNELKGNRIFFGRYNSETPVSGQLRCSADESEESEFKKNRGKLLKRLKGHLADIEKQTEEINNWIEDPDITAEERQWRESMKYTFQRLKGDENRVSSEMRSRFDMQQTPPDILITNYSMLAIMLMRAVESPMIEKTRKWLEEEPDKENPTRIFHLVIDELHLNRGTSGTEIACLLRVLISRLGLRPDSKQLRILASSASLESSDPKSIQYLRDFFNRDFSAENIVEGPRIPVDQDYSEPLPIQPFVQIFELYYRDPSCFDNLKDHLDKDELGEADHHVLRVMEDVYDQLSEQYNVTSGRATSVERVLDVFMSKEMAITQRLYDLFDCREDYGKNRAIPFDKHSDDNNVLKKYFYQLFGEVNDQKLVAAEGFIILRGLYDIFGKDFIDDNRMTIPRLRFHFFFKNIGGLWATLEKPDWNNSKPVGRLHASPTIIDRQRGNHRVLELLYCEECGTVYYGGRRHVENGDHYIMPTSPGIEGLPEQSVQVRVERKKYDEYAIFWPVDVQSDDYKAFDIGNRMKTFDAPKHRKNFIEDDKGRVDCNWIRAQLNALSGEVCTNPLYFKDDDWHIDGYYYMVNVNELPDVSKSPALPTHCPFCGADHQNGKKRISPLRGFRAGFAKTTQAYARELFYQIPTLNQRKLVTFSDSREDAASVANGIEREQFTALQRDIFIDICSEYQLNIRVQIDELKGDVESLREVSDRPNLRDMYLKKQEELDKLQLSAEYIKLSDLLLSDDLFNSELYKRLSGLGVNPAGSD